jgi:carbonic anhydrase/acetyltransferase-like protein (isoleucine patch superfamily)
MIIEHLGKLPSIDPTARVAPTAVIRGEVTIGANTSVGFGAVIVAESGAVAIGRDCVIMDTAVIRGVRRYPVTIGDHVLVGPRAHLSGCAVADDAFLATGASVFNGARIGRRAEVRINGLVHLRTVLPDDATVPINWVAVGDPVQILPPDRHDEIWGLQRPLDFPRTVFGTDRPRDGQSIMPEVMPRYAAFLGRAHSADRQHG